MPHHRPETGADLPRALLSSIWTVGLFNIVFRDIHQFLAPGFIDEIQSGALNGTPLTPSIFLLGGILLQIPFAMILVAHAAGPGAVRFWNTLAAPLAMVMAFLAWPTDPDDWLHVIAQLLLLGWVLWIVRRPTQSSRSLPRSAA